MLNLLEAALFTKEPVIGSMGCICEVQYLGYKRVPVVADEYTNLTDVVFPECEQDTDVWVTHVAVIDGRGVIVGVKAV